MDRALVSVEHFGDLAEYLPVVRRHSLGLELQEFSEPGVLDNDWRGLLDHYQQALDGFAGMLSMHGAYIDLVSGSPDMRLVALTRERYSAQPGDRARAGCEVHRLSRQLSAAGRSSQLFAGLGGTAGRVLDADGRAGGEVRHCAAAGEYVGARSGDHQPHSRSDSLAVLESVSGCGACGVVFAAAVERVDQGPGRAIWCTRTCTTITATPMCIWRSATA